MHNVLILGSGRSGTSMLAGALARAGYFMGPDLIPPRESNPKGFFESSEINGINEDLIAQVTLSRPGFPGGLLFRDRPVYGQRWLSVVPLGTTIPSPPALRERIAAMTKRSPFCFKDPRFCYTLPVWRPFLQDTVFLCIFRHPSITVASILKECRSMAYLRNLRISFKRAVEVWKRMYLHVLEIHRHQGDWLFLHFNQVLTPEGLARVREFTGAKVDVTFPEKGLQRTPLSRGVPGPVEEIYETLCGLAGYHHEQE